MPDLDAEGKLAEDVFCRRCGYNLRGLLPTGVCPECEMLISLSTFSDQLRFSDPNWIARLFNGTRLLIGAIFASIGAGILGVILMMAIAPMTVMALLGGVSTLITVVWVAAVWMLTTPDPGAGDVEKRMSARTLARWCALAWLAAVPIEIIQQQGIMTPAGTAGTSSAVALVNTLLFLAGSSLGILALVGTAAGIVYLHSLALRIPSDSLAWHTKIAGWGYVAFSILGKINGVAWWMTIAGPPAAGALTAGMMALIWTNCFFALGMLVFGIWMTVLLFGYAFAFRTAREGAERFAAAALAGRPLAHRQTFD